MAIAVIEGIDRNTAAPFEAALNQVLRGLDAPRIRFSPLCAHIFCESLRFLKMKRAEHLVLSSSTIFIVGVLLARNLAVSSLERPPSQEQMTLKNWGAVLSSSSEVGNKFDALAREFFEQIPSPSTRELTEPLEDEPLGSIEIGPGLNRSLMAIANEGRVDVPLLFQALLNDSEARIVGRLNEAGLLDFIAELTETTEEAGRQTRMVREAHPDELALGIHDFALALATILRTATGEFSFALFGRWGSGKTTLVSLIDELLKSPEEFQKKAKLPASEGFTRLRYEVVRHNAWKYRTPPEAWIYIYKSLADNAAASSGLIGRAILALRTSIERKGNWPLAMALVGLAVAAMPKYQFVTLAASIVGVAFVVHVTALTAGVSGKVRELFAKHLKLTSTDEKLGMLALIGDDVRALLKGWVSAAPLPPSNSWKGRVQWKRFVIPLGLVLAVSIAWAFGLVRASQPEPSNEFGLWLKSIADLIPSTWIDAIKGFLIPGERVRPTGVNWFVWGLWSILSIVMVLIPHLPVSVGPDRVLLVVDDLDRCTPAEMLGVIEGIKLLLDDPLINARLQVLMLVDEGVLGHAIGLQYQTLISERAAEIGPPKLSPKDARAEVIAEQKEKLFACHLRFAHLSADDVSNLVEKLAGRENEEQREMRRAAAAAAEYKAQETLRFAEASYESLSKGTPVEKKDENAPSRTQPSMQARMRTGDDTPWPMTTAERERVESENRMIDAYNEEMRRLTPEQRLARDPSVSERVKSVREALEVARQNRRALGEAAPTDRPGQRPLEQGETRFSDSEVSELKELVPKYFLDINRSPSPRAIRALLFKIQLCRLLLQLRFPSRPSRTRSVRAILKAFTDAVQNPIKPNEDEAITIARQVI